MDPFLGEIRPVGFTFAPQGWALCAGQILPIAQNTALFSLLGTTFGGDGVTTFALPDLRSRVAVGAGQGPGLTNYDLGQDGGVEQVSLASNQLPAHSHHVMASSQAAVAYSPESGVPGKAARTVYGGGSNGTLAPDSLGMAGQGLPHENHQPFLSVLYVIALQGIYPPRP
ncbi:MAG TPA: tail fiber protein [Fimbriimonadaceae bacterium]|nr:tail fiber protein [Fimbriimonadaceae bacterium]